MLKMIPNDLLGSSIQRRYYAAASMRTRILKLSVYPTSMGTPPWPSCVLFCLKFDVCDSLFE